MYGLVSIDMTNRYPDPDGDWVTPIKAFVILGPGLLLYTVRAMLGLAGAKLILLNMDVGSSRCQLSPCCPLNS